MCCYYISLIRWILFFKRFVLYKLAKYLFFLRYLNTTMGYLMTCVHRKEKNQLALITIGYIAVCIEGDIAKYIPGIINYIRTTLPQSKVRLLVN